MAWQTELGTLLDADVSLVVLSADTEPVLGWGIARTGQRLYETQLGTWRQERARLWHAYNDALPFRRALDASIRRYAIDIETAGESLRRAVRRYGVEL